MHAQQLIEPADHRRRRSLGAVQIQADLGPALREARGATRGLVVLPPHADLHAMAEAEHAATQAALADEGALAAVASYDPASWTLTRLRLWREVPAAPAGAGSGVQRYAVGHVSAPRTS
jgi:hypothetical protein